MSGSSASWFGNATHLRHIAAQLLANLVTRRQANCVRLAAEESLGAGSQSSHVLVARRQADIVFWVRDPKNASDLWVLTPDDKKSRACDRNVQLAVVAQEIESRPRAS